MLYLKIHKWLFSIALIASIVSFSGYINHTETMVSNSTELLLVKKPVSKTAVYYFGIVNSDISHSFNFSFKTLLKNYNLKHSLMFKTINERALQYVNHIQFKGFIHFINQDHYHKIFIG